MDAVKNGHRSDAVHLRRRGDSAGARLWTAFAPNFGTPILLAQIIDGRWKFGGGDKDVVVVFIWGFWSLAFTAAALLFWYFRQPLGRSLGLAALFALLLLLLVGGIV